MIRRQTENIQHFRKYNLIAAELVEGIFKEET
jgi:hypothetical protein